MDTEEQVIRVLVADDHNVVRAGLIVLLDALPEIHVVAEASDGIQAVEQARHTQPDVILLDLMMPRKTGIEAIPDIRKVSPHSQILILTSFIDEEKFLTAIRAGALGYLIKQTTTETLRAAIRLAHQGFATLDPATARRLMRQLNRPTFLAPMQEPLTDREAEVLILLARGLAVVDIAAKVLISEQTVYRYIASILNKFREAPGPDDPLEPPLPLPIPVR